MCGTIFAEMDDVALSLCSGIIPNSYVNQGKQSLITQSNLFKVLLEKVSALHISHVRVARGRNVKSANGPTKFHTVTSR